MFNNPTRTTSIEHAHHNIQSKVHPQNRLTIFVSSSNACGRKCYVLPIARQKHSTPTMSGEVVRPNNIPKWFCESSTDRFENLPWPVLGTFRLVLGRFRPGFFSVSFFIYILQFFSFFKYFSTYFKYTLTILRI